jgi:hypothetical protein
VTEGVAAAVGEVLRVSEAVAVADADPLEALLAETALLPEGGAEGGGDREVLRAGEDDAEGHMETLRDVLGEALSEALPRSFEGEAEGRTEPLAAADAVGAPLREPPPPAPPSPSMPAEGVAPCVNDRKPVGLPESCAEGLSLAEGAPLREGAGERDVEPLEVAGVDAEALPEGGREALADGVLGAVGDPELDCPALREAEAPEGEELPRVVRERVAAPEDVPLPPLPEGLLRGEADGLGEEDGHAVAEGGAEVDGDEEPHGDGRGEAEAEPHAEAPPLGVCAAVEDALPLPLRLEDVLPVGDELRPPLRLGDALPVGDALPPTLRLGEAQGEGEGEGRGERDEEALREDAPLEDAQKEGFAEGEAQNEEDAAEEKE